MKVGQCVTVPARSLERRKVSSFPRASAMRDWQRTSVQLVLTCCVGFADRREKVWRQSHLSLQKASVAVSRRYGINMGLGI